MSKTYTTRSGDLWDLIAYTQLGSASYLGDLLAANTAYTDYFVLPAGLVLALPEVKAVTNASLPPWRR